MPEDAAEGAGPPCRAHPLRPARAACAQCNARLCNDCYRFRMNGKPACAACAYGASTRTRRWVSLAVSFAGLCLVALFTGLRRYRLDPAVVVLFGLGMVVITGALLYGARNGADVDVTKRLVDDADDGPASMSGARHPYRGRLRKVLSHVAPRVSGTTTALVVGTAFLVSGVLLPTALKLPRWIETELVLTAWWVVLSAVLSFLLYRGYRLADDWVYFSPWDRPASADETKPSTPTAKSAKSGLDWGCSDGCSGIDGEGALVALVVGAALALLLGAAWVLVEIAAPLVCLVVYALVLRAVGRVARDNHQCQGDLGRAVGWGLGWATLYLLPLAALTGILHLAMR